MGGTNRIVLVMLTSLAARARAWGVLRSRVAIVIGIFPFVPVGTRLSTSRSATAPPNSTVRQLRRHDCGRRLYMCAMIFRPHCPTSHSPLHRYVHACMASDSADLTGCRVVRGAWWFFRLDRCARGQHSHVQNSARRGSTRIRSWPGQAHRRGQPEGALAPMTFTWSY